MSSCSPTGLCFLSIFLAFCLTSLFMLENVSNYKADNTILLHFNNDASTPNINYSYIPPNNNNCTDINNLFNNLWIKPIEITLFAMLNTFKSLNISCVLYGGTLLSYLRHTNILAWDKDGDVAFLLPLNYTLKLDEFLRDVFIPKLNKLYPSLNFTCIINTDAIYSLFNCRLINKPGYVDAFAEYQLNNKTLFDKLQYLVKNKNEYYENKKQFVDNLSTEIIIDNIAKINDKDNNIAPFIWNHHFLDTNIHLKPVSILFPGKYLYWNRFYVNNYNVTKVSVPQDEIEIAKIFYGDNYMTPPDFATNDEYGICDRQKARIETFCFGTHGYNKYDRGGVTVQVTQNEINLCNEYKRNYGNPNGYDSYEYHEYHEYKQYDTQLT